MVHVQLVEAAAQAGKAVFCEKPVGGTPEQIARAAAAAREAGVISGVGFNYRWAPLVRYARELIAAGELGEITNYRGRFFSMYGADPLGVHSWRFRLDEAGYGVTSDLMSHAVDLAHMLLGPITRVAGTTRDVHPRAPGCPAPARSHYGRGRPEDPRSAGDQRGLCGDAVRVRDRARAARSRSSRTMVGPESERRSTSTARGARVGWNFERLNELRRLPRRRRIAGRATRRCSAATASRITASSCPAAQHDRLRGPGHDRGLRVLHGGRRGPAVRPSFEDALAWAACRTRCCARRESGALGGGGA